MSKQVSLPKLSSILQKIKIDPKCYLPTFHNYFSIRILNGTKSNTFLQERTQYRPRNIFEYSFLDFKSFDQQENRVQMKIIQSIHNNISTPEI